MKNPIPFCLSLFIALLIACDKDRPLIDCENPDYSNCITIEPFFGFLDVHLTFNDENTAIPLTIYLGKPEHDVVFFYDTIRTSQTITYELNADTYYSAKAEYRKGNKVIHAYDGGFMEKKSFKVCDSICWVVVDLDFDLKID